MASGGGPLIRPRELHSVGELLAAVHGRREMRRVDLPESLLHDEEQAPDHLKIVGDLRTVGA